MSVVDRDGVIVLGNDSVTPANNITIKTPDVADGSVEIYRGVPGNLGQRLFAFDASDTDFNAKLSAVLDVTALGRNQTWQDVTASRTLGVTYTNSTEKPIFVAIRLYASTGGDVAFYVDGVLVINYSYIGVGAQFVYAVVPAGSTYSATSTSTDGNIYGWSELR